MTRKQIESAASEAALRMMFRSDIHPSQQGEALFIDGAELDANGIIEAMESRGYITKEDLR